MMGKDCERILSGIASEKDDLMDQLNELYAIVMANTPIEMEPYVIKHKDGEEEEIKLREKEISGARIKRSAAKSGSRLSEDFAKMRSLESGLYSKSSNFNNSYGSPWTELNKFREALEKIEEAKGKMQYVSQVIATIGLVSAAIAYAADAKSALITYHDYVQRGYDANYNNKRPSIEFKKTYVRKSVGNIKQDYDENVNIEPDNIDPY